MKRHSFVRGLLTAATLVTGVLLLGSTSASAQNPEHVPAQLVTGSTDLRSHTTVRPPVLSKARVTCRDGGADVVAKLRNPNATLQAYMVGITAGDIHHDYVVRVAAHGSELVEFGVPDGTYLLRVMNAAGDLVARAQVRVQCEVTPPTGTPTATPTGTPTATPSETPTTVLPTGPSPATTAVPSTPVDVPTAVEAGLTGPVAPDDSNHSQTIVGAGMLAAVGIMLGMGSLVVLRRRRQHQL